VKPQLMMLMLAGCVAGACSNKSQPGPVISVKSQSDYEKAVVQAVEYCDKNYGYVAHTPQEWEGTPKDIHFVCEPWAAHVFLPTEHIAADEMVWNFDTWAVAERPLFLAMVKERMSRYGTISAAENHALWPQMKTEVERRFRRRRGDI
jgi:hypothetical protein